MLFVIEGEEKRSPVTEPVRAHLEVFSGRHFRHCVSRVTDHDR